MKKSKKVIAILLATLSMSFTACDMVEEATKETKEVNIYTGNKATVWGADATEKVFQTGDGFAKERKTAAINLTVAKGEKEASQIIISAESNLTYDFIASDLSDGNGNTFQAEKVDVFHEKYMEITTSYNNTPTGMYPDAIVPLENIKSVGENVVKEGENQGVYVRFDIPLDQTPGVYTGNFTLKIGDKTQSIPVALNVLDLEVSEVNHVKSVNEVKYGYFMGEKNGSQEMLQAYNDFLYEYRLCSNNTVHETDHSEEGVAYFTEVAYQNMQNPKCSFISIPYDQIKPTTFSDASNNHFSISEDVVKSYLRSFAAKTFETGYNMFLKAGTYIGLIDEPEGNCPDELVKEVSERWTKCCYDVADEIRQDETIDDNDFKQEVITAIERCYNVVTTGNVERYANLGVTCFCSGFPGYDTEEGRAAFDEQYEKWWYGCIFPRSPYPNYQIDDNMISPRVMGWMQADYDVVGNLFWAFDYYTAKGADFNEDFYGTPSRFPRTNGDGFLLYPGSRYGIDGPVASLRLETIRDGFEEYELLRELKMKYKETGVSLGEDSFTADALFDSFSSLYDGTRVITEDSADFQFARTAMLNLCLLNKSSAEVYLTEIVDKNDSFDFVFFAKNGTVMKNAGVDITNVRQTANGSFYTVTINMDGDENRLQLEVVCDEGVLSYTAKLGGRVVMYNAADLLKASDFSSDTGVSARLVDDAYAATLYEGGSKLYTMELKTYGVYEDQRQVVKMTGEYVKLLTSSVKQAALNIRYFGDDVGAPDVPVIISAKFKNSSILEDIGSDTLGWMDNLVYLSLETINWEKLGEIEYLRIQFGNMGEGQHQFYINELTLFNK